MKIRSRSRSDGWGGNDGSGSWMKQPAAGTTCTLRSAGSSGEMRTEDEAGRDVEAALAKRVDHLDRATGLSDQQKRKLHAAGRGDIKRFLDRLAEAKRGILSARDLEEISVVFANHSALLQQEWAALRGAEGPIFAKASRRTLTDEQRGRYEKDLRDRREYRYRAAVRWTVVMIARSLGLTDGQRRRLEAVLLEETRVPENLATYDYAIVMYQASLIPEARIRPVFDEVQWRVMSQEFAAISAVGAPRIRQRMVPCREGMFEDTRGMIGDSPTVHGLQWRRTSRPWLKSCRFGDNGELRDPRGTMPAPGDPPTRGTSPMTRRRLTSTVGTRLLRSGRLLSLFAMAAGLGSATARARPRDRPAWPSNPVSRSSTWPTVADSRRESSATRRRPASCAGRRRRSSPRSSSRSRTSTPSSGRRRRR